jgi:hypothetical protein
LGVFDGFDYGFGIGFGVGEIAGIAEGDGGAVSLETFEGKLRAIEGAFKALLEFEALIDETIGHVVEAEEGLAAIGAGEFPIIYGHAFDLDELGRSPGLPLGFEILKEIIEPKNGS